MAYCTNQLIKDVLGTFVDYTNDLTVAQIDVYIAKVDGRINDRLGGFFYPFNATTDTPDTPDTIKEISRHWSIAESLRQLVAVNNEAAFDLAAKHEALAMNMLDYVLTNRDTWMLPETKSGDALTFGTGAFAWSLLTSEAFLASSTPITSGDPPNILPSTVRISAGTGSGGFDPTQLRTGIDFYVTWRPEYRKWVFTAAESQLLTSSGLQVTYQWDYRRLIATEQTPPSVPKILVSQFA